MKSPIPLLPSAFLVTLTLTTLAISAYAQTPPPPPPPGEHPGGGGEPRFKNRLEMMTKALNLTEDQQTKIGAIFHQEEEEMHKLFKRDDDGNGDEKPPAPTDAQKAEFKAIHEKFRKEIFEILTPEQRLKFKQMIEQHEAQEGQGQGQRPPGGGEQHPPAN